MSEPTHRVDDLYPPPPWHWSARAALWRHWVREPVLGLADILPHHLLRALPTDAVSAFGAWLGPSAGRKRPEASARALALLRRLRPEADAEALLAAHWRHVGQCFAEFSALHRIYPEGRVEVTGLEHVEAARAAGRSVLVAGLHVGAWEVLHTGLAMLRIPTTAIYQRQPNRFRMRIADAARRRAWSKGVPLHLPRPDHGALFGPRRVLEQPGGVMLYYIDEYWQGRVHAPALGRPLRPEGNISKAVRLAAAAGAAVIPAYALRLGDGARFRLTFLPEVPMEPGKDQSLANQARLDSVIEAVVREHPEQWFMLHVFRSDG